MERRPLERSTMEKMTSKFSLARKHLDDHSIWENTQTFYEVKIFGDVC